MKVFVAGRQTGKTHKLVEWVKEGTETIYYPFWSRVMLVSALDRAQHLRAPGNEYGLAYNQVYSFHEWRNAHLGLKPVEVGIDNAEELIGYIFGQVNNPVRAITINGELW